MAESVKVDRANSVVPGLYPRRRQRRRFPVTLTLTLRRRGHVLKQCYLHSNHSIVGKTYVQQPEVCVTEVCEISHNAT
jgi:hypothetical protein